MSIPPNLEGPGLPPLNPDAAPGELSPAELLRKRVFMGFGAVIAIGLGITAIYIGGRLFARPTSRWVPVAAKSTPLTPKASPDSAQASPVAADPARVIVVPTAGPSAAAVSKEKPKPAPIVTPVPTPVAAHVAAPLTARSAAPGSVPTPVQAAASSVPEPSDTAQKVITPQPRERYLQLAALGPHAMERYVPQLRKQGFNAVVAPGPVENVYRILVGPFPDQPALERQRDVLEAAGIQSMLRVY